VAEPYFAPPSDNWVNGFSGSVAHILSSSKNTQVKKNLQNICLGSQTAYSGMHSQVRKPQGSFGGPQRDAGPNVWQLLSATQESVKRRVAFKKNIGV
ncbi:jg24703, partial [Pararge aegeria aegeria]